MKYQFFFLLVILSSCGQFEAINADSADSYSETSTGEPIELEFDKRACLKTQGVEAFWVQTKHYSANQSYVESRVNYSNNELSMNLGGYYSKNYNYNVKTKKLEINKNEIEQAIPLRLCAGEKYDTTKTYESAALMVYSSIKKAQNFLHQFSLKLPALKYSIAPLIKKVIVRRLNTSKHTEESTLINNAFFDYNFQEIVFLPQGITNEGYIPFNSVPLWQIPFVPIHEYGHHLFSHLFPSYYKAKNNEHRKLCFDNRAQKEQGANFSKIKRRHVSSELIFSAFNEGVADLVAHYVVNGSASLDSLACLGKSRDVANAQFRSGETKLITSKSLEIFLSSEGQSEQSCFNAVNFQDVHMIGAVIAYGFNSTMDLLELKRNKKMEMIINWIKTLENHYKELSLINNEKEIFKRMLILFLEQLKAQQKITQTQESWFYKVFPLLWEEN